MRTLYSFILYLLAPFVLLRLLWLGTRNSAYWQRWNERFGYITLSGDQRPVLWVHAVSVGEVQASKPIINYLLDSYSQYQIVITTITPTGADSVKRNFADSVRHLYLPYDLPGSIQRFINALSPKLLIIMETELWPNLYQYCKEQGINIVLANARMSEKSARGYARFRTLSHDTLSCVSKIAAQTQVDADRLIGLGARSDDVSVTGNLKFDIKLPQSLIEQAQSLRRSLSVNRSIWIAASTHDGEEEQILDAFDNVLDKNHDCLLIIAPRHPERSDDVFEMCKRRNYLITRRSNSDHYSSQTQIFLLDTLGELPLFYAASDLAFVGGSLIPKGGQNVLEPASLGLPVLVGPYTHNFMEINQHLEKQGASWRVTNSMELANCVNQLLADANLRHNAGENARKMVEDNRGSSKHVIEILQKLIVDETSGKI